MNECASIRVSVVVPTCRRPELLQRCLHALLVQTLHADAYEVLVVDDGCDDATRAQVKQLAACHPSHCLRYVQPYRSGGPAAARNRGWRLARGELIAFTDDDTVPAPGWLAEGERALHAGGCVALAGRVQVPRGAAAGARPTDHERMTLGLEHTEFVTANAFVRRQALAQVGGLDERFRRPWREDSDLQFRLQRDAGRVGRAEAAVVQHPVRPERWGVSLRQQKNVYFDALLYAKHPALYRARIRRVPPWDHYAVVACSTLALAAMLAGAAALALAAAAAALVLVLRLAWQRLKPTTHAPTHVLEMLATSALIPFLSVYWRLRGALHFRTWFF